MGRESSVLTVFLKRSWRGNSLGGFLGGGTGGKKDVRTSELQARWLDQ